jgi:hypothetical protein
MRHVQVAVVWLIIAGAATYLFLFDPAKGTGYPACPFRQLTGLQCPGCGGTRSLHQLLHGNPIEAFALNPLLIIALPFLTFLLLSFTRSKLSDKRITDVVPGRRYGWIFLALVVGFWIFRNTKLYPFAS